MPVRRTVRFEPEASAELRAATRWWAENRSADEASRWYIGFSAAIDTLADNPERFPFADENEQVDFELRELHYGIGRRKTHRAVFTIRDAEVVVLAVRHVAQGRIVPDDLTPPE